MSTKRTWIALIALIATVATTAGVANWYPGASRADPVRPDAVADRWAVVAPATVEPVAGIAHIAADIAGRIDRVYVRAGDAIEAGSLIAELRDAEQRARLKAADVEVAFRKAERDQAILDPQGAPIRTATDAVYDAALVVERLHDEIDEMRRVKSDGNLPATEKAELQAELAQANQAYQRAKAELAERQDVAPTFVPSRTDSALALARSDREIARVQLEKIRIRAPFSGSILQLEKVRGDSVDASVSDVVATIADLSHLHLRAEISERWLGRVAVGQEVTVRSDVFDRKFHGRVTSIGMTAIAKRLAVRESGTAPVDRVIEVLIALDDGAPVVPGMLVDAYLHSTNRGNENEINR